MFSLQNIYSMKNKQTDTDVFELEEKEWVNLLCLDMFYSLISAAGIVMHLSFVK